MIRIAQVEFEALSHRFPRDHTKYFLGFQCLGYYLGFEFLSSRVLSLLCFGIKKLFCINTIINAHNTTTIEERIQ